MLGPILNLFKSYLGQNSTPRAGAQHMLNADYFKRIDALNFTMMSDDGQLPENLEHADIVLVGVSRTSKTPTSIYLANRGYKTANIPLVPHVPLPRGLAGLRHPLIVGLVASADRIVQIRQNRLLVPQRRRANRICRPGGRRRGNRRLAAPVRRADLAGHRRLAPLDRGNRGRDSRPLSRPPPQVHRPGLIGMSDAETPPKPAVWSAAAPLVLASKSASRRALLAACGLAVETIAVDVDERALEDRYLAAGGSVEGLPSELARAKAVAASALRPEAYCLGADQTLTVGTRLLHKARNRAEAAETLAALARTRA